MIGSVPFTQTKSQGALLHPQAEPPSPGNNIGEIGDEANSLVGKRRNFPGKKIEGSFAQPWPSLNPGVMMELGECRTFLHAGVHHPATGSHAAATL
jgi:hypothetical protein